MKVAYTTVLNDGNHNGGSGISETTKKGTGIYFISYDTPFASSPGVSSTPWGSGFLCSVNIMAENMCEVLVTDLKGNPIDCGFAFLAVGD